MTQITQITSDPSQTQTFVLADGTTFQIALQYVPMQYGWFITSITYQNKNFTLNGRRVCNSPNMLHQFLNQIPFGIACYPQGLFREPTQQQDFSSGNFILYVLSQEECQQYAELLSGIASA